MSDATDGIAPSGDERDDKGRFLPGNKSGAGRRQPGFAAIRKKCLRDFLGTDELILSLKKQIASMLEGELDALKFVLDYSGLKPAEETHARVAVCTNEELNVLNECGWEDDTEVPADTPGAADDPEL